jgi:RNA polymerase sigma-70 factor (ECF subfamily)
MEDDRVDLEGTRLLLRRALDGEESARCDLLDRLRPRLVLWITARLSAEMRAKIEAEDVAQEVLLAVHRGLDAFEMRDGPAFYAWLFRLAENRIRDQVDYFGARKRQPEPPPLHASRTSPSGAAIRSERLDLVREALARLSEDHRRVIQLRRLEEKPVEAVAEEMGRTPTAVRVLYCRALKALRREMDLPDFG